MPDRIHDYSREEFEARRECLPHTHRHPLTREKQWEEDVREFPPHRRRKEDSDEN